MTAEMVRIDVASPFATADELSRPELETEGRVRYLAVQGQQDDGLWGTVGAIWLSEDGLRGGFLVNPWAIWEGSEIVRGYRTSLERGFTPASIFRYWQREVWRGSYTVDEEREAETLFLLHELVDVL
jgi:hypothetical protein